MRSYGGRIIDINLPADTVLTSVMTAGAGQAFDWPGGSSVANLVRFSGATTASGAYGFGVNLFTTQAHWSAAASTFTTGSSGTTICPTGQPRIFKVPGNSTGFSMIGGSSGIIGVEVWKMGG